MSEHRNRTARRSRATQNVVVAGAVLASAGIAGGLIGQAALSTAQGTQTANNQGYTQSDSNRQSFNGAVTSQGSNVQPAQAQTQGS